MRQALDQVEHARVPGGLADAVHVAGPVAGADGHVRGGRHLPAWEVLRQQPDGTEDLGAVGLAELDPSARLTHPPDVSL